MADFKCFAPVFPKNNIIACIILAIIYTTVIILLLIGTAFLILLSPKGRCIIKQYQYRIKFCMVGNSNPDLEI